MFEDFSQKNLGKRIKKSLYPQIISYLKKPSPIKTMKKMIISLLILSLITLSQAWLDPPTSEEKQYFKDKSGEFSQREFTSFGISYPQQRTSINIYTRKTLEPERWTPVFREAFNTNPTDWFQVYDYVLNQINKSNYHQQFGYFNQGNDTYWVQNITLTESELEAHLISSTNTNMTGSIQINNIYWNFWTGIAVIDDVTESLVMVRVN